MEQAGLGKYSKDGLFMLCVCLVVTFRFAQKMHISFYQSVTFRFAGLTPVSPDQVH